MNVSAPGARLGLSLFLRLFLAHHLRRAERRPMRAAVPAGQERSRADRGRGLGLGAESAGRQGPRSVSTTAGRAADGAGTSRKSDGAVRSYANKSHTATFEFIP